jgi:type II secretory pathway pseudopilin PulG
MTTCPAKIQEHGKEIVIVLLIVALCIAAWLGDRDKGKLNSIEATQKRMENISSAQAGRKEIQRREQNLYPALDRSAQELAKRRTAIRDAEKALPPPPTRKEIEDAVKNAAKGDSGRLADMFRADGYPCAELER